MRTLILKTKQYYETWGSEESLVRLPELYADNIEFIDPIHKVHGIQALSSYFYSSAKGLNYCNFEITNEIVNSEQAVLLWTMRYSHKRIDSGADLSIDGNSYIKPNADASKIEYQKDYYDLGEMLLDHIPLIGYLNRQIKTRIRANHANA